MPTLPLAKLAKIRMGATLRGRDATRPDPAGSHRLIQISDIDDEGRFRTHDFIRVSPREPINESLLLRPGDLLFPNRGMRTTAAVFDSSDAPTFVGAQFFVIEPLRKAINPHYLAWALRTREATAYFDQHRRGTNVLTLQKPTMENFEVPVPSLETQFNIVQVDQLHQHARDLESRLSVLRSLHLESTLLNQAKQP